MPQNPVITYQIGDSIITLQPGQLPPNFDSLPPDIQNAIRQGMNSTYTGQQQPSNLNREFEKSGATFLFLTLIFVLFVLAKTNSLNRIQGIQKQKFLWFFITTLSLLIPSINGAVWPAVIILFILIFIGMIKLIKTEGPVINDTTPETYSAQQEEEDTAQEKLQYIGRELNLSLPTVHNALTKHWPYFSILNPFDKEKFTGRLQEFIAIKTFDIYDDKGLIEMPILISAAAIQLTFGLDEYLLEDFPQINIHPKEFIGVEPFVRVLEGNVSCGCINLSWKHFLDGINNYNDGQNVGLHEMSHALYSQCFTESQTIDESFRKTYEEFNACGNKVFETGKDNDSLYSDYAYRNIQEFWAESIEIFFERPVEMRNKYGALYAAICDILNQDPANNVTQLRTC
jgi:Mlc titration factor MtfA (ptsG expression regulator)